MSHAYTKNHVHVVFSTKERRKSIAFEVQPELWSYMAGICRNQEMVSVAIGGVDDHVHLLFHLPATLALSRAITLVKANSSKWMNEHGRHFAWQEGYSAFSVSSSNLEEVAQYIRKQKEHHQKMTFEDEYLSLLRKHRIEFDPEYVFG
jgi:REP element-mobilizing transposase RayT